MSADLIDAELTAGIRSEAELQRQILEYGISVEERENDEVFCACMKPCATIMRSSDGVIRPSISREAYSHTVVSVAGFPTPSHIFSNLVLQ